MSMGTYCPSMNRARYEDSPNHFLGSNVLHAALISLRFNTWLLGASFLLLSTQLYTKFTEKNWWLSLFNNIFVSFTKLSLSTSLCFYLKLLSWPSRPIVYCPTQAFNKHDSENKGLHFSFPVHVLKPFLLNLPRLKPPTNILPCYYLKVHTQFWDLQGT